MQAQSILPNLGSGNKVIYACVVGSHLHGIANDNDPIEKRYVFVQSYADFYLNGYQPTIRINENEIAIELKRFTELCGSGNLKALEILFAAPDCIIYMSQDFNTLIKNREKYLSKELCTSFTATIESKVRKIMSAAKKKIDRRSIYEFCTVIHQMNDEGNFSKYNLFKFYNMQDIERMAITHVPGVPNMYSIYHNHLAKGENYGGIVDGDGYEVRQLKPIDHVKAMNMKCIGVMWFDREMFQKHLEEIALHEKAQKEIPAREQYIMLADAYRLFNTGSRLAIAGVFDPRALAPQYIFKLRGGHPDIKIQEVCKYLIMRMTEMKAAFERSAKLQARFTQKSYMKYVTYLMRREVAAKNINKKYITVKLHGKDDKGWSLPDYTPTEI